MKPGRNRSTRSRNVGSRLDLFVFVAAFFLGFVSYLLLHFVFHFSKNIIIVVIIGVMILYAVVVYNTPRLRIRMDQAGDNAYYLGLLFTLVSMAIALYEFQSVTLNEFGIPTVKPGPEHILSNFGIALASTITGIFLRVVLHQMRIDPADVEAMTRIDLAEASRKVQTSIDAVTNDLGRFHDELRQKSRDLLDSLIIDASDAIKNIGKSVESTTKEMIVAAANVQTSVLEQTEALTKHIADMASEATAAIERLRSIEQPPQILINRFQSLAETLESVGDQIEKIGFAYHGTAESTTNVQKTVSLAVGELVKLIEQIADSQKRMDARLDESVGSVVNALGSIGLRLERDQLLLKKMEEEATRFSEESNRARESATKVLVQLTEIAKGITSALRIAE